MRRCKRFGFLSFICQAFFRFSFWKAFVQKVRAWAGYTYIWDLSGEKLYLHVAEHKE